MVARLLLSKSPILFRPWELFQKNKENTNFRIIHDASRPRGQALNDYADLDPFQYQSLQDAMELIKPGSYLAKVDLKNAFRSVGVQSSNYNATGLEWRITGQRRNAYMIDTLMCFEGQRSPGIFNTLTQAIKDIMAAKGITGIVVYCDDFLIVADTFEECRLIQLELIKVLRKLGFDINYDKVEGPSQVITFLGIEINTINMTTPIPASKISDLRDVLLNALHRDKINKRALY